MTISQALTSPPTAPSRTQAKAAFDANIEARLAWDATNTTELAAWAGQANALASAMNTIAAGTAYAIPYTFSTTTADADPGPGTLRLNQATQNTATVIRADVLGSDGSDWTAVLDSFDDSTSAAKGQILLVMLGDATKWIAFNVTSVASPSGYRNITAAVVASSSASPFAGGDALAMKFTRNGDKGETGLAGSTNLVRVARTSNTVIDVNNKGNLIDITGGAFTQTFDAAATLGDGWFGYIRNAGTGDITLDPNGAETIDGLASFIMYPGEARLIQCDGTALRSVVLQGFTKTFTSSGSFTKPPGYESFDGLLWGGGSSGQRSGSAATESSGGAGGGCGNFLIKASSVATTETVTIGAGGAAVTTVANGNVGGTTSFGSHISAFAYTTGGIAWRYGGSIVDQGISAGTPFGYEGGSAAGSSVADRTGVWGGGGTSGGALGASGSSVYGGAGGGSLSGSAVLRDAGTSKLGGNGGAASSASNGTAGSIPGGGGGATQTGAQSGAGGRGELIIRGVA